MAIFIGEVMIAIGAACIAHVGSQTVVFAGALVLAIGVLCIAAELAKHR